ncbi:MAG: FAD-dependent 5-carboxymethylaminomethyl-2-thiouridine(34) oxidoreductase MnmC [Caulobacteraceae bacterium]|nr:FAD-dependent 5-carboxymethylaminomethyl-2-thiouridine(34) oxidoreductase MnmC [Caulobacteraceae bacterium]
MPDNDPQLIWTEDGAPRSRRFDDVYFSAEDGLGESRAVFLAGSRLPEAWKDRPHFTVAELGFGSGLNIAALLELWARTRPEGARLHVFSVEGYPMPAADAARALARWPELETAAGALTAVWPTTPGFHRIDLPPWNAVLDVAVMDARDALALWSGRADAWFLDGFAPSTNPGMWSDEILGLVAARSAPGARLASFTVAGAVRRGLQAAGFEVEKRPGFGRKRERLEAVLPGGPTEASRPSVAILGAGIAGAALCRALRAEGVTPVVFDKAGSGAGASGNRAALVTPRFDAGGGPRAAFFVQAFARAVALYDQTPHAVLARGVIQLESGPRDPARFDQIAGQPGWRSRSLSRVGPYEASTRLGEQSQRGGLWLEDGFVVEPQAVLADWLGSAVSIADVAAISRNGRGWSLSDPEGREIAVADAVVLAAGWGLGALRPDLKLTPARGQVTLVRDVAAAAAAWGGYVVPTREGLLFGATFDRNDTGIEAREADNQRNLETLAQVRPQLAAELAGHSLEARAAIRATTPDHLPYAGALAPGLWVLGGLGARGFTTAPLLAEHLAARIVGRPSPLPDDLGRRLEPTRPSATSAGADPVLS